MATKAKREQAGQHDRITAAAPDLYVVCMLEDTYGRMIAGELSHEEALAVYRDNGFGSHSMSRCGDFLTEKRKAALRQGFG